MTTTDHGPPDLREQAHKHADQARTQMDRRRAKQHGGVSGWVAKRAGEWDLSAKIRTRLMPAVELDHDPDRAEDGEYVERKYHEVQDRIQAGMDALARKRALPLFG